MISERVEKYCDNLKEIVETECVDRISEKLYRAGIITGNELNEAFAYLKSTKWKWIDAVLDADEYERNKEILSPHERKKKMVIDAGLNRKIRNLFPQEEAREILKLTPMEAEQIYSARVRELLCK